MDGQQTTQCDGLGTRDTHVESAPIRRSRRKPVDEAGDEPRTTRQLPKLTRVPNGDLSKVLQALARADIIRSQRGLGGGFTLASSASQLTAYDEIPAVDPIRRIRNCPLGIESHRHKLCPLHQHLDDALARMEASFRRSSIADLIGRSRIDSSLCRGQSLDTSNCRCIAEQADASSNPSPPVDRSG